MKHYTIRSLNGFLGTDRYDTFEAAKAAADSLNALIGFHFWGVAELIGNVKPRTIGA